MVKHISKHLGHLTVSGFWIALKQFSWKWFVLKSVRLAPLHHSIHFLDKLLCFISIKGNFKIILKRFLKSFYHIFSVSYFMFVNIQWHCLAKPLLILPERTGVTQSVRVAQIQFFSAAHIFSIGLASQIYYQMATLILLLSNAVVIIVRLIIVKQYNSDQRVLSDLSVLL